MTPVWRNADRRVTKSVKTNYLSKNPHEISEAGSDCWAKLYTNHSNDRSRFVYDDVLPLDLKFYVMVLHDFG